VDFLPKKLPDGRHMIYSWFSAMHTRVDLVLLSKNSLCELKKTLQRIENEIVRIEQFANKFDSQSELSLVNRIASKQPASISPELSEILIECEKFKHLTLGYFDIAVGVGLSSTNDKYIVDKQTLKFHYPDVQLDLSGYIKGYALRNIKHILDVEEIADALINIGNSSIMAKGNHAYGDGWNVQVISTGAIFTLYNKCLTTSGNHPETLHPIINPRSGNPAEIRGAFSVVTADGGVGEVLAKALYLANEEDKLQIEKNFEISSKA
jgi:thiamine biosynthesis lipoprotein